jgi:DNA-directed RNA polymerase subunit RPC12/RpoP
MVTCWYNHFAKNAVSIYSWEHRCADCGYRVTKAFRTDDPELDPTINPTTCPYCGRQAAAG